MYKHCLLSSDSESVLYYVQNDKLLDILHDSHNKVMVNAIGHGGRDRMIYELKTKYLL